MKIRNLYPGSWGANCYLLISGEHAAVVDPSAPAEQILNALQEEGAQAEMILLTHGHFDHIVSIDTLRDQAGIPALIHEGDTDFPADAQKNGFAHFFRMERTYRPADRILHDGDVLNLGDEEIRVIHTPGHTQGCVCFLCNGEFLLTGDTLFDGDRGRTDLYGGNEHQLISTLQSMRALDQNMKIYPGHGTPSLLGNALDSVLWE